jgi:ABC-2 type transport system ATP-binding protein
MYEIRSSSEPAIESTSLTKRFGDVQVLDGLDLEVAQGSVVALLGPNGAGKTTTVRLLATLLRSDGGSARVAGFDVITQRSEVRRRISLVGQHAALDDALTGAENLEMLSRLRGLSLRQARRRRADLLAQFGLTDAGGRRVATYSGGMRRRLDIAAALVTRPEIVFLDEPTTGLDPRGRQDLWSDVEGLAAAGVTVLLTTQYLEEADRLAKTVIIIDEGRVVARGTPLELKARVGNDRLDILAADRIAFDVLVSQLSERIKKSDGTNLTIEIPIAGDAAGLRAFLDSVDPRADLIKHFSVHSTSLDDVFLALTDTHATPTEREALHV